MKPTDIGNIQQSSLLEQLVECSPNGIIVVDKDMQVEIVNPTTKTLLPLIHEPIGKILEDVFPVPPLSIKKNFTGNGVQCRFVHGSRTLFLRSVPLPEEKWLLLIEDVTAQAKSEQYRKEFVANVSHELRTPATSIAGYAQMLLDEGDNLDPDILEMIGVINRNAQRLGNLFDDLLTLSRVEANDEKLSCSPIALRAIVNEAVDKQMSRAEVNGISFQVAVDEALDVFANRDALNHVVGNLVENAVKYNRKNGLVTLRATFRPDYDCILFEVIDFGYGISEIDQQKIFERFYRVSNPKTRNISGTGLGLSIVKRLTDRMGAKIEVRSKINQGTVFRVFLQRVPDE
jgi:two-component system, OmpR family, phosphate regulon sensor histidine kinase PhoR